MSNSLLLFFHYTHLGLVVIVQNIERGLSLTYVRACVPACYLENGP